MKAVFYKNEGFSYVDSITFKLWEESIGRINKAIEVIVNNKYLNFDDKPKIISDDTRVELGFTAEQADILYDFFGDTPPIPMCTIYLYINCISAEKKFKACPVCIWLNNKSICGEPDSVWYNVRYANTWWDWLKSLIYFRNQMSIKMDERKTFQREYVEFNSRCLSAYEQGLEEIKNPKEDWVQMKDKQ